MNAAAMATVIARQTHATTFIEWLNALRAASVSELDDVVGS